jgi:hypothetical protein
MEIYVITLHNHFKWNPNPAPDPDMRVKQYGGQKTMNFLEIANILLKFRHFKYIFCTECFWNVLV